MTVIVGKVTGPPFAAGARDGRSAALLPTEAACPADGQRSQPFCIMPDASSVPSVLSDTSVGTGEMLRWLDVG